MVGAGGKRMNPIFLKTHQKPRGQKVVTDKVVYDWWKNIYIKDFNKNLKIIGSLSLASILSKVTVIVIRCL